MSGTVCEQVGGQLTSAGTQTGFQSTKDFPCRASWTGSGEPLPSSEDDSRAGRMHALSETGLGQRPRLSALPSLGPRTSLTVPPDRDARCSAPLRAPSMTSAPPCETRSWTLKTRRSLAGGGRATHAACRGSSGCLRCFLGGQETAPGHVGDAGRVGRRAGTPAQAGSTRVDADAVEGGIMFEWTEGDEQEVAIRQGPKGEEG